MLDAVGPLYPHYVKDIEVFHCPADRDHEDEAHRGCGSNYRGPTDLVTYDDPVDPNRHYIAYPYDSYTGQFGKRYGKTAGQWQVNTSIYEGRYSLFRAERGDLDSETHYKRQLRFRNPPADTVVTWCSFHRDYVRKNRSTWAVDEESIDIVLFLDGSARPISSEKVLEGAGPRQIQGFVEP